MEAIAYSVLQAAEVCGLHADTIRKAIRSGQLIAKYPTRKAVILRTDLELWLSNAPESRAS
jgi:excisionase family DNA binding protein